MRQALEDADRRYADLEEQYGEMRSKYDSRGPRDEDLQRMRQVSAPCQGMNLTEKGIRDHSQKLTVVGCCDLKGLTDGSVAPSSPLIAHRFFLLLCSAHDGPC